MHPIEDDLKAALGRKPAPAGFSDRLLDRIEGGSSLKPGPKRIFRQRPWVIAAAAMIVMTVLTGVVQYQKNTRTRNEAALQQTLSALSIAAEQLDRAKAKAFESLPSIQIENQR